MLDAHLEARDFTALRDLKRVAEYRRIAELFHERRRELRERVTQNHDLGKAPELVEELLCARHRINRRDGLLNLLEPEAVLLQNVNAVAHQLVVVRLVPCCAAKFRDARSLRKRNPDFGNQHALQIQANNIHVLPPHFTISQ